MNISRSQRERNAFDRGLPNVESFQNRFRVANVISLRNRAHLIRHEMSGAQGKTVLEIGSSSWVEWLLHNGIRPAHLTCINISQKDLDYGKMADPKFPTDFLLMDAHELEFEDESFDMVFGSAILHHLDLSRAMKEIYRVLRPNGTIVFFEPLGINPASKLIRALSPGARTADERPINLADLRLIEEDFRTRHYFDQLLQVPFAFLSSIFTEDPDTWICRIGGHIDELLKKSKAVSLLFRYILIVGEKRPSSDK